MKRHRSQVGVLTLNAGFTLVEVLVVLAIMAVLGALLFATFSRVREKGRNATCQSNLHQMALALQQYVQDHNGRYAPPDPFWTAAIYPYVNNEAVFYCPSHADRGHQRGPLGSQHGYNYIYNQRQLVYLAQPLTLIGKSEANLPQSSTLWTISDDDTPKDPFSVTSSCGTKLVYWPTLHSGGGNYAFLDGHIKWLTPQVVSELECSYGQPYTAP
jgi:prepilin-type N-terminal cleavage/methylation domain-containing protein/prepilin-type processing-associated H-X9-DG protein